MMKLKINAGKILPIVAVGLTLVSALIDNARQTAGTKAIKEEILKELTEKN